MSASPSRSGFSLSDGDARSRPTPAKLAESLERAATADRPVCAICEQPTAEERFHRYRFDFEGFACDPGDYPKPAHLAQFGEGECDACWQKAEDEGPWVAFDAVCERCGEGPPLAHCLSCGGRCKSPT